MSPCKTSSQVGVFKRSGMSRPALMGSFVLCLGLLTLVVSPLGAASDDQAVLTFRGPVTWAMATKAPEFITPALIPSGKLYTIYSNLGPKDNAYNPLGGYPVSGPGIGQTWTGWPFSPKTDAIVTEIKIALTYSSGPINGAVVSLNESSEGLPGKALHAWNLRNLPNFATCCTMEVAKDGKGLPVEKGKTYWIVAETNKNEVYTIDIWNGNVTGATGRGAFNQGQGWQISNNVSTVAAFGVFGQKTQ